LSPTKVGIQGSPSTAGRWVGDSRQEEARIAEERKVAEAKAAAEKVERERKEKAEKRRLEREAMEKDAVELHEHATRCGFNGDYHAMVTFGTALLRDELQLASRRLKSASQFEDKEPLQQAVETVRSKIEQERKAIAHVTLYQFCYSLGDYSWETGWKVENLIVDLQRDRANYTMFVHSRVKFSEKDQVLKQEIVEKITFPVPGVSVESARLGRINFTSSGVILRISGNVADIQELWENKKTMLSKYGLTIFVLMEEY
jgi:hypothetical protein